MDVYIEQRLFVVNNEGTRYNMHIAYCQGKTHRKNYTLNFLKIAFQKNTLMCVYLIKCTIFMYHGINKVFKKKWYF